MIELTIDNVRVALSADFSLNMVEENPILTDDGEYTFDVELSLLDEENALVYQNIARVNSVRAIPTGRIAVFRNMGKKIIAGYEYIIGWRKDKVIIQVVAGNSTFKQTFSSEGKIWDNDFGDIIDQPFTEYNRWWESMYRTYPEFRYVYAPVLVWEDETDEAYTYDKRFIADAEFNQGIFNLWDFDKEPEFAREGRMAVFPYLAWYLDKLIELKGFTSNVNVLHDDEKAKRTYFLHNRGDRTRMSDFLPDWTEAEFIDNVCAFFNIDLLIDVKKMTIDVVRPETILNANAQKIEHVIDDVEVEILTEDQLAYSDYDNCRYAFPDKDYFKFQMFDEGVLNNLSIIEFADYETMSAAVPRTLARYNLNKSNRYIYKLTGTTRYFLLDRFKYTAAGDYFYNLREVNIFHQTGDGSKVELKIHPARMYLSKYWPAVAPAAAFEIGYQYPWLCEMKKQLVVLNDLFDTILKGEVKYERQAILEVAMYQGIKQFEKQIGINPDDGTPIMLVYDLPISTTDFHAEIYDFNIFYPTLVEWQDYLNYYLEDKLTFRFDLATGLKNTWFVQTEIDRTQKFSINFLTQDINPLGITLINNRKFLCESIDYTFENDGVDGEMKHGLFYAVK